MLIHTQEQEAFYFLKSEWRNQDGEVRKNCRCDDVEKNKQEDLKKQIEEGKTSTFMEKI